LGEVDQGVGVALRGGAPVDLGVGWAGRSQRAQCRADDLRGLAIEPSDQLTTTVAVPQAQVAVGVRGVVGAATVLI
jgi:hypothetical protein